MTDRVQDMDNDISLSVDQFREDMRKSRAERQSSSSNSSSGGGGSAPRGARRAVQNEPTGIDDGEPVSGVEGPGSPHDGPEQPVEGPGENATNGMGGSSTTTGAAGAVQNDPTGGMASETKSAMNRGAFGGDSSGGGGGGSSSGGQQSQSGSQQSGPSGSLVEDNIAQNETISTPTSSEATQSIDQGVTDTVGKGSPASEKARDIADTAVDLTFQNSQKAAEKIGLEGERAKNDDIAITGPDTSGASGPKGTLNQDVTDSLTGKGGGSEGWLSEKQEAELRKDAKQRREFFGFGEEADQFVTKTTGSETAGNVARGIGNTPGDAMAATATVTKALDTGTEVAANTGSTVDEHGVGTTAQNVLELGGRSEKAVIDYASENPGQFAGGLVGDVVIGTAAIKGASRGSTAVKNARTRQKADETVDLADITTDEAAKTGDLPNFETDPGAPASKAVGEVKARARNQPDAVQEATGTDDVLFHSTEADLPDNLDVERGGSELPGLFTSPDASPLRLNVGSSTSLSDFKPRLPRPSDIFGGEDTGKLAGFEGDRIDSMAPGATGSGRVRGPDGDFMPDPETSGAKFLDNDAEPGTAYVRPTGGRTTELEAIFPPGSEFSKSKTLAVDIDGGRTTTLDVYKRPGGDADAPEMTKVSTPDVGETRTARDIDTSYSRRSRSDASSGQPVAPPMFTGGPSGGSSSSSPDYGTGGSPPSSPGFGTDTSGPSSPPTSPPSGGSSFDSYSPGSPPSSPPTSPPSGSDSFISSTPSSPPSSPPSSGGSSPPTFFSNPPSSSGGKKDFDFGANADDSGPDVGFTTSSQTFENQIGSVEDVIGGSFSSSESDDSFGVL